MKQPALALLTLAATVATLSALPLARAQGAAGADAAKLGVELTPAGAERGANADKSIPVWPGNEVQHSGWAHGQLRAAHWKHKGDKPLFSIDAASADQHAARLAPGQLALLKQVKGYRMDVYPSRRTCGVPDFVADNTKKNVSAAKIGADGWSLAEAMVPGFPFPMPANGTQAMWNAKMRYRGVGMDFRNTVTSVAPRKGGSEWIRAGQEFTAYMPWGAKGSQPLSKLPKVEYYAYFAYNSPPALAGQALAIAFFLDQPGSETFYYFPGQRRVRRMPSYSYDSPQIGMENQYTLDEPFVFNGTIDRFDWKLVGKRELIVPYNAFGAYDFKTKFEDIAKADAIDPAFRRYELHRVWVVEASLKPGTSHIYAKRNFYIDEDSWAIVATDKYDGRGELWRYSEQHNENWYNVPMFFGTIEVHHDLQSGRYIAMGLRNEETTIYAPVKRSGADYSPNALRSLGTR